MRFLITLGGALILIWTGHVQAAELQLAVGAASRVVTTEALLQDPRARSIKVPQDVAYKRAMDYRALPARTLLEGVAPGATLRFTASDGFAAQIPAALVLASSGAQAFIAVEDPAAPWPALSAGKPSAGPFYLVWLDPAASHIGPEQWPYQIARIDALAGVAARFPAMAPAADAGVKVAEGFAAFQKHCMACHRLNGGGDARMGPDLNMPFSPLEYLGEDHLRRLVRDPQALRRWPEAKMVGFSEAVLPEAELDSLVAYLRHMRGRKAEAGHAK